MIQTIAACPGPAQSAAEQVRGARRGADQLVSLICIERGAGAGAGRALYPVPSPPPPADTSKARSAGRHSATPARS